MPPVLLPDRNGVIMDDFLLSVQAFVHVFAEEGLRNFFDVIAITYEKGAKSSLYRALPDITSNRRYIGSPPCQQISSSLYPPFRYSGPRYIGPPTVYWYPNKPCSTRYENDPMGRIVGTWCTIIIVLIVVYGRGRWTRHTPRSRWR